MQVLLTARLDPGCRRTGACLHVGAETSSANVRALALCETPGGVALLGCGTRWEVLTRTVHPNLRLAKHQAEREYLGVEGRWEEASARSTVASADPAFSNGTSELIAGPSDPPQAWELIVEREGALDSGRKVTGLRRPLRIAVVGHFRRWTWGQYPDEAYLASSLSECGADVYCIEQEESCQMLPPADWVIFTGHPGSYVHLPGMTRFFKTVLWTLDWLPDYKDRAAIVDAARQATLFISSDQFDWKASAGLSHHRYLPAACERVTAPFRPNPRLACAFLGSLYSPRRKAIAEVIRSFGGELRCSTAEWLYGNALARFVQGTKIIVGDNARNDVPGYWSSRNYIIPGLGGFLLTARVPGLDSQFRLDRHLAVYGSVNDLPGAIAHWLSRDVERERIRRAGYLHVRRNHSWAVRARELLRMLGSSPAPRRRRVVPSFHRATGAYGLQALHETAQVPRRLAIVGWANDSGVGREFTDALDHLPVSSAFVLHNASKPTKHEVLRRTPHVLAREGALDLQMERFIAEFKPDTILTWEVPGSWSFPALWKRRGIRWLSVVHWDWFASEHQDLWKHAELIAPNEMCRAGLARMGLHSTVLPVPVDTSRFAFRPRKRALRFVSVYGFGGIGNRRGLPELAEAWARCSGSCPSLPPLVLRSQAMPTELTPEHRKYFRVEVNNRTDPADLFAEADIAVQPSRFEGVGLSLLEAQACGVPVITVDAEPMRSVAPDLLVSVGGETSVSIMGKPVASSIADIQSLADRVKSVFGRDIGDLSTRARRRVEEHYSWNSLGAQWNKLVRGIIF